MRLSRDSLRAGAVGVAVPVSSQQEGRFGPVRLAPAAAAAGSRSRLPRPLAPRHGVHPLAAGIEDAPASGGSGVVPPVKKPASAASSNSAPPPLPPARAFTAAPAAVPSSSSSDSHPPVVQSSVPPLPRAAAGAARKVASGTRIAASSSSAATAASAGVVASISQTVDSEQAGKSTSVADRVVGHWRAYTQARVADLSLDHRATRHLLARHVRLWHQRCLAAKHEWKSRIHARTAARFHFLRVAFARWRVRCAAEDRPSVRRREVELLASKAAQFWAFQRRRRALALWRRYHERRTARAALVARAEDVNARAILRDALHGWRWRLESVVSADQIGEMISDRHLHHVLTRAYTAWRESQESSALARAQAGAARRFAYRGTLRRMVRAWQRAVELSTEVDRRATQLEQEMRRARTQRLWREWRAKVHRQSQLARVVHRSLLAFVLDAKQVYMRRWRAFLVAARHEAQLIAVGARESKRRRLHTAVRIWRARVRLWQVQRLMGAAAFARMERTWANWRRALATVRADRRTLSRASDHAVSHALSRSIHEWRRKAAARRDQRARIADSHQVWLQRVAAKALHQWCDNVERQRIRAAHQMVATRFHHEHACNTAIVRLAEVVSRAASAAHHRWLVRHHICLRALSVWRRFTTRRLAHDSSAHRAKRFRYLRTLRVSFRKWSEYRSRQRAREARLTLLARPIQHALAQQLLLHWRRLARLQRRHHMHESQAVLHFATRLKAEVFEVWRACFEEAQHERINAERALRYRRTGLLARILRAWDAYSYAQKDARRRVQEGMVWLRRRLDEAARQRLFRLWQQKLATLQHRREQIEQADLHHARVVLCRAYRTMQHVHAARRARAALEARLTSRVHTVRCRTFYCRWRSVLAGRRRALHKHARALHFWSARILRMAWRAWIKYHRMKQFKAHQLQAAMQARRDKLRRSGLIAWIAGGLALHDTTMRIAHQQQRLEGDGAFSTLRQRRLAFKCVRMWREIVRRRRAQDERMPGMNRRIAPQLLLPFNVAVPAPMQPRLQPIPMTTWTDPPSTRQQHGASEDTPSSFFDALSPFTHVGVGGDSMSLFPSLAKNRPPPRRPAELLQPVVFPFQLPLQAITAYTRAAEPPSVQAQAQQPIESIDADPYGQSAPPMHSHSQSSMSAPPLSSVSSSVQQPLFEEPPPVSAPDVRPDQSLVDARLASLEDHLHRLLTWKRAAAQRRTQLRQMQSQAGIELTADFARLQQAVAEDQEHRVYYEEQARQVQQQLRDMMEGDAAADRLSPAL